MRTMKPFTQPATTKMVTDRVICDVCRKDIPNPGWYEKQECQVSMETGSTYPECGDLEKVEFDICVPCFTEKLIPWFAAFNAPPRVLDTSY
jgi:hypothetical protein